MGDIVYITPMFRAVKIKYPESKLYVVGAGRAEEVIRHNPDIDEYINYEGDFWSVVKRLWKEKIDFACLANAGSFEGLALLYLSGVKCISAFSTINDKKLSSLFYYLLSRWVAGKPFYTGRYIPTQYLRLLEPIGANTGDAHFRLYFSKEAENKINSVFIQNNISVDDFIIAFAPGGAVPERWWPAERFTELAKILHKEHNAKILIIGAGKDEKPISDMLAVLGDIPAVNLLNQNLDEFKATISKCDLVIGNDSGPMVTADAFDVPQLIFVGPTNEKEYHMPPRPLYRIMKAVSGRVHDISVKDAILELNIILNNLKKKKQDYNG